MIATFKLKVPVIDPNSLFAVQNRYSWGGRLCQCSDGGYCAAAAFLQLEWIPTEGFFGCLLHQHLVAFSEIPSHLSQQVHYNRKMLKQNALTIDKLLDHMANSFGVERGQTKDSLDTIRQRPDPIPLLSPPIRCIRCNNCNDFCSAEKASDTGYPATLRMHTKKYSQCLLPPSGSIIPTHLCQLPFGPGYKGYKIVIDSGPNPLPSISIPLPEYLSKKHGSEHGPPPAYITKLKWDKVFLELKADPKDLIHLIRPPQQPTQGMHTLEIHFENMLKVIRTFGRQYLMEARNYAVGRHSDLRQSLTSGSRSVCL